jgi:stage II sporulation protein D
MAREEYVAAVLAGESSVFRSEESLKAMAVAARTYACRFRGRHAKEGFDFCDTTHCQDLRLAARTERLARAVEAAEGEMLWHDGAPAATFYHRHCGGTTEADPAGPYLRQQHDGYCIAVDRAEWQATLAKRDIVRALREAGFRVGVETPRIEVVERSGSGRVRTLRVGMLRVDSSRFHAAVGQTLGWTHLRSTRFDARDSGGAVTFRGRGAGHGIGLCQAGAAKMGEDGRSYRDILAYYFPGTKLGVAAQGLAWQVLGGERADVWTTDAGSDSRLPGLADRMVAEAERRTGFRLANRPAFKFYPTVASFRDSTGEAGWVAAVSRGRVVRLQPAAVLRSAGVLESTLLHESLHQAIESRAHPGLPEWLREGLVLVLEPARRTLRASRGEAAEVRKRHADARARVERLVSRHGLDTVTGWVASGLPAGILRGESPDERSQ